MTERPDLPATIAVLGAGSWGTTFAKVVADAHPEVEVRLWARRPEVAEEINTQHRNTKYLKDIVLPGNVVASADVADVVADAPLVVLAVPAQTLRPQLASWKPLLDPEAVVVSLMKGLERGSDARMSEVIKEELGLSDDRVAVISGPNLAMEIARKEPTASVVACTDEDVAQWIARLLHGGLLPPVHQSRCHRRRDRRNRQERDCPVRGICDGKGMGDNTKATVITRGLAETTRLTLALGGDVQTMAGLAGLGDLVATCSSPLSRNHTAGRLLGEGLTLDEVSVQMTQTAEGIESGRRVLDLATRARCRTCRLRRRWWRSSRGRSPSRNWPAAIGPRTEIRR